MICSISFPGTEMRGFTAGGTTEYRNDTTRSRDVVEMEGGFRWANIAMLMYREKTARRAAVSISLVPSCPVLAPLSSGGGLHTDVALKKRLDWEQRGPVQGNTTWKHLQGSALQVSVREGTQHPHPLCHTTTLIARDPKSSVVV
ncbi:hypothetical protein QYF61_021281 [Mycteria americana]|uniref:Uncharacterized protein n=1 Tax=Mycteria americana TaxID=33587 RepID=A0AAN7N9G8_MYCAM|nr:hypothetical protein QYF61_021281 [Mycteria americana]